ncbi:MAG: hypothetical protein ACRDRH_23170 [Pseudonocardia sp.]
MAAALPGMMVAVPLSARFRPGSARRPFVNREPVLQAFADATNRAALPGADPEVLVLAGIGGIGKSRLLGELRSRLDDAWATAVLDLQVPAQRQPETALAVLRAQFGTCGVRFRDSTLHTRCCGNAFTHTCGFQPSRSPWRSTVRFSQTFSTMWQESQSSGRLQS